MHQTLPVSSALRALPPYREILTPRVHTRFRECPTCLGPHEDEIHLATLRIHRWFRAEVTRSWSRPALV